MDVLLAHFWLICLWLAAAVLIHIIERRSKHKGRWAAVGFVLHVALILFFAVVGASLEELLFVLLLSAAVALA